MFIFLRVWMISCIIEYNFSFILRSPPSNLAISVHHDSKYEDSLNRKNAKMEKIKSSPLSQRWYKNKQQHITKAQKKTLNNFWSELGIDLKYNNTLDFNEIFSEGNQSLVLEIGFGTGDNIVDMALNNPRANFLGVEIHKAGIAAAMQKINNLDYKLQNIKFVRSDALLLVEKHVPENSVDKVCIYFPDPWPNFERDLSRRIIRPDIISHISKIIKSDGVLHIITDVKEYADYSKTVMEKFSSIGWNLSSEKVQIPCHRLSDDSRAISKYELKAKELGHMIWNFEYVLRKIQS